MFFSASTNGFYTTEIHGSNMPSDVVEITNEYHFALMQGQSAGLLIRANEFGQPVLMKQEPLGQAQLELNCKAKAKELLANTDWSVLPDVSLVNKADFVAYRSTLRNLVIAPVASPVWPTEPEPIWK